MQNMSIFEFADIELDPVYVKVAALQNGEEVVIDGYQIRAGEKFYEIESEQEHLPFRDLMSCYRHLTHVLVVQVNI